MSFLKSINANEEGATLTEFMLVLPVFIMIFAGIVSLGQMNSKSIVVEAQTHIDTFAKARNVQETGINFNMGWSDLKHMLPTMAGADATMQVEQYGARHKGAIKNVIRVQEHATYSFEGLAVSGSLGESNARLRPLRLLGVWMPGVDEVVTAHPENIFGMVNTGSALATEMLYDGPSANVSVSETINNAEFSVQGVLTIFNQLITVSGARGALAAGNRYGTVTGVQRDQGTYARQDVKFQGHYTVTVAPYVHQRKWDSAMRATAISRLTMFNTNYGPYNAVFGFTGTPAFDLSQGSTLDVPREFLGEPLNYQADLYQ